MPGMNPRMPTSRNTAPTASAAFCRAVAYLAPATAVRLVAMRFPFPEIGLKELPGEKACKQAKTPCRRRGGTVGHEGRLMPPSSAPDVAIRRVAAVMTAVACVAMTIAAAGLGF